MLCELALFFEADPKSSWPHVGWQFARQREALFPKHMLIQLRTAWHAQLEVLTPTAGPVLGNSKISEVFTSFREQFLFLFYSLWNPGRNVGD